ncbi:MAG TPA: DnaJ domain-containing protein, partial [Polyangiaceae bacterium]|nr:DnaJ domain-containing protein [Polyangiaceae bacterium]
AIYFASGSPAKARVAVEGPRLAEAVIDLGLTDRSTAARLEAKATEQHRLLGELLVEEQVIDETALYLAMREHLQRQVLALCALPESTQYGIYDANLISKWGPSGEWRVKPLPLIWRALMTGMPTARVQQLVGMLGDRPLRMRFEAPVSRYRMQSDESSLIDLIRARAQPIATLEGAGIGRPGLVRQLAAALFVSRQLDDLGETRDPVGLDEPPESPASLPPPSQGRRTTTGLRRSVSPAAGMAAVEGGRSTTPQTTPQPGQVATGHPPAVAPTQASAAPGQAGPSQAELAEFRREIETMRDAPASTFYELLGVPETADSTAVRAAFFRLARRWHPDRLPSELEDLRPIVTKTFSRMGEAHQVLGDPVRRAEYDKASSAAPDSEQEKVIEILEAASAYQRAEILVKKRDLVGALTQAKLAYELDASQADHIALYAWLEASQKNSGFEQQLKLLDSAAEMEPSNVRVLWHRAQLLKKMGKVMPAVRDFRMIVELKPNHVDAQRELRVYEMRRRTDTRPQGEGRSTTPVRRPNVDPKDTASKPGLFGRLLKKD